jgi:hypothetical protein
MLSGTHNHLKMALMSPAGICPETAVAGSSVDAMCADHKPVFPITLSLLAFLFTRLPCIARSPGQLPAPASLPPMATKGSRRGSVWVLHLSLKVDKEGWGVDGCEGKGRH